MRKFINNPDDIAKEIIDGFVATNPDTIKRVDQHVVARKECPIKGKVGILIGGGAGHEPLFLEFVGEGMADVSVHGQIFAAPPATHIFKGIQAADSGEGVILLYNNYAGDVLNFDMAQDMAEDEDIRVETVLINDEISSAPPERREDRRGTTADHVVIHIAGAAAESGLGFDALKKVIQKAVDNSRSLGVSTSACTFPQTGKPTFELEDGKMGLGMGIHGEAGTKVVDIVSADEIARTLIDQLVADLPFQKGDEVIALINGYGATTRMELFLIMKSMHAYLEELGISIYASELGEFCTAQEMAGVSMTLTKLDTELKKYYDMPAYSPGYKRMKKQP